MEAIGAEKRSDCEKHIKAGYAAYLKLNEAAAEAKEKLGVLARAALNPTTSK